MSREGRLFPVDTQEAYKGFSNEALLAEYLDAQKGANVNAIYRGSKRDGLNAANYDATQPYVENSFAKLNAIRKEMNTRGLEAPTMEEREAA